MFKVEYCTSVAKWELEQAGLSKKPKGASDVAWNDNGFDEDNNMMLLTLINQKQKRNWQHKNDESLLEDDLDDYDDVGSNVHYINRKARKIYIQSLQRQPTHH